MSLTDDAATASTSATSSVPNLTARTQDLHLGQNGRNESNSGNWSDDRASSASPQNLRRIVMCTRGRRALRVGVDEPVCSSWGQSSRGGAETSRTSNTETDRPPSNSTNAAQSLLRLEARSSNDTAGENAVVHNSASVTYNWQGDKATIQERFAFLFNNEILSDVRFLVGRGAQQRRIPAHKLVLSSGSAVFDAMFNGTLATASPEIEVPDVEPVAFLAVLLFLYTDELQIGPETVMTTLYIAKKYAISPLEKHCVEFLRSNLTSDNACLLLTQARLFDEPQLASVCLDTIDEFTTDALNADGFIDIDIDTLMVVLERDTLRIRESKIFQAVVRWSEAECARQQLPVTPENQRSVLGRALSLVRFPLMSVEEFAAGPAQCGLLTDREVVSLFLYFTVNPKPPVGFEAMPRCRKLGKELTVCRFQNTDLRWGYSGTSDRIRFNVDRRIFLIGYGVYGSAFGPAEYQVLIELIHTASGKVVASNETSFSCDGSNYTYRLTFKEPAEIISNTIYTASAKFRGPDSHYGTKGLRRVTVDCDSGKEKVKFQFSYAAGDNNGTSLEDGQIPELIFYI